MVEQTEQKDVASDVTDVDVVELGILWQRLQAVVDEADRVLGATAFSSIVREAQDYVTALLDPVGRNMIQCTFSIGSFIGTMPITAGHILDRVGRDGLEPGDVLITNDAYLGTGHAYDITMITPIFLHGALVGFAGNVAHMTDIGGLEMSGEGQSIYEEGVCFPPMKLFEGGREVTQVFDILRANVRVPDQVMGDVEAQVAANQTLVRGLQELMAEYELTSLDRFAVESWNRSEQAMRRIIAELPNGTWHHEAHGDGFGAPVVVAATVTIEDDSVLVDFTGTSPQSERGINSPSNYTRAYSLYALKCILGGEHVPNNHGALRPFSLDIPVGCCINPRRPAPTAVRGMTGQLAVNAILGAFAQVVPEQVIAESGSCPSWMLSFNGSEAGRPFSSLSLLNGGLGARPRSDGYSALTYPVNCTSSPIELLEATTPIRVRRKELIPDSAGPGKHRGGFGQRLVYENVGDVPVSVSLVADKVDTDPSGVAGGLPGQRGSAALGTGERVASKGRLQLAPGETLHLDLPGGGGFGAPAERSAAAISDDIRLGLITEEHARRLYGNGPATSGGAE